VRIAYIANSTIPSRAANSIHVMKQCQALRQLGHDVELIARRPAPGGETIEQDALWHRYGVRDPFPLRLLRPTRRLYRTAYAVRAVARARRSGAELVWTRNYLAAPLAAWLGIPTLYEAHGLQDDRPRRLAYRTLWRSGRRHRFATITEALARDFRRAFPELADAPILVLPDGVDLERFTDLPEPADARRLLGWPDRPTLGYAGHLYPGRGVDLLLEIAADLPGWSVSLMGGTEADIDRYRELVRDRGLTSMHVRGFIPNAELPLHLAACEALAMPHQRVVRAADGGDIAAWTSPMKMFEYLATGRLVLASDLPVLREVLTDENAVLLPSEHPEAWRAALHAAAADPAAARSRGAQGRRDVQRYSWRERAERALARMREG